MEEWTSIPIHIIAVSEQIFVTFCCQGHQWHKSAWFPWYCMSTLWEARKRMPMHQDHSVSVQRPNKLGPRCRFPDSWLEMCLAVIILKQKKKNLSKEQKILDCFVRLDFTKLSDPIYGNKIDPKPMAIWGLLWFDKIFGQFWIRF